MAFSFGKPATSAPTGGLFGSLQSQPGQSQPGQPGQQQQQQQLGGSLFGSGSTTNTLFGQSTPFGGASTSANASKPLFGSSGATSAPTGAATSGLFGQSQSAASSSLFGAAPKPSLLQQSQQQQPPTQQPLPKLTDGPLANPNEPSIESRIEAIKDAWDPSSPRCRFTTFFYNAPAPPLTVSQYGKPPSIDDRQWSRALRENPDPDKLVPAIAIGFASLDKRIESQSRMSASHAALLEEIHTHLETLSQTHALETSLRVARATNNARALRARLVDLVARSSRVSPARNQAIRKEEDDLRVQLERLSKRGESVKSQSNELWARIGTTFPKKGGEGDRDEASWAVVDQESFRQVLEILSTQQNGLDHLTRLLNEAHKDVRIMQEAFGVGQPSRS